MEPACAQFVRGGIHVPLSLPNPCRSGTCCTTRVVSSVMIRPALANHVCSVPNCAVAHWLDAGWPHERFELREFQATRRSNLGCSRSSSVFENLEGFCWFRDQPRFNGATQSASSSSAFGNGTGNGNNAASSPASTSGRRGLFAWGRPKTKKSRMGTCRCSSQELNSGDDNEVGAAGDDDRSHRAGSGGGSASDQTAARAGTLESELFLYTGRMRALENFREEAAKPDEEINLIRAAAFVAQHLYPRISADEVEAELEAMAAALEPLLPPLTERYTMRMINSINSFLYGELGYKGATNYLDPDNSCINMVLKRREGLPLTMSLVYMELAKRVGLPMQGVNLPAHFMCRPTGDGLEFFIDAHANGKITFLQDAEERLSVVYGLPVEINPEFLKHTDITNRAFLLRLLFNLKRIYFERKDPVSTLCIIDYLKIVRPGVIEETRDYGICLYLLNRFSEAIPCLEAYIQENLLNNVPRCATPPKIQISAKEAPRATDAESMRSLLTKMRRDKMS